MTYYLHMMILGKLQTVDLVIIIGSSCAIVLGILIFLFAGLHKVPKNHAIIFEKAREYYCTYDKGIHFKTPIAYQKVGTYCIVPQTRGYISVNGNHLKVTYQIEDVVKYHYSYIPFDELMQKIEKENSEINATVLIDTFNKYGLKFISIDRF